MSASKAALNAATGPRIGKEAHHTLLAIKDHGQDPTNDLTPDHIGQFVHDTANDTLYWAHGLLQANWKLLT